MEEDIKLFESKIRDVNKTEDLLDFMSFLAPYPLYLFHNIQFFFCDKKIDEIFKFNSNEYYKANLIDLNNKVNAYKYVFKRKNVNSNVVFFIQRTSTKNLYLLHSMSFLRDWNYFIKRFLDKLYPSIVRLFWKQNELVSALKELENNLIDKYEILVRELIFKERRNHKKYDSDRKWTKKTLTNIIQESLERDQWFKKVKFQLFKRKNDIIYREPTANCSISKYGHLSLDNSYYDLISLLKYLEKPLINKINLFKNKGLKERDFIPSSPIIISYEEDVFKDRTNLLLFINKIKKYPHSTKAIYHYNPYFYASIADFKDGSSFEVRINDQSNILIVPQIKTSIEGLERLISFIFESFKEGEIKESSPLRNTL